MRKTVTTLSSWLLAGLIVLGLSGCNSAIPAVYTAPHDAGPTRSFVVVSTGQNKYYNDAGREIPLPRRGQTFYGQDAQYATIPMQYNDNGDGTVTDNATGLMWIKTDSGAFKAGPYGNGAMNWQQKTA